jgi:hypothetical protein
MSIETIAQPFACDPSRVIDRLVIDADAVKGRAVGWLEKVPTAAAREAKAEARFLETLDEADALDLLEQKRSHANCVTAAAAIEAAGGPSTIRDRALATQQIFALLESCYREREAAITKLLPAARKILASARASWTERGLNFAEIEFQPETVLARVRVESLESAIQDAVVKRGYCQRWNPKVTPQFTFVDLYGCLTAPLPTP